MIPRKILSFLIALMIHHTVQACSVCGCGDPLASAGTAMPLPNTFQLSLESQYLTASAQSDDLVSTESVRQVNLNTTLTYNLSMDLSLSVMLPVVEKYWSLTPPAGPDEGTPFGIGDLMMGARYFFLSDTDFKTKQHEDAIVSGGVYFPTGRTDAASLVTGQNLDTHAQLGTGAWAFYGGLRFNRGWDDLRLSAYGSLILRTAPGTTDPNSPVYQYTFGNALTGGVQGQLNLTEYLAASLALEGRTADSDRSMDGTVPNTGGTVIDLTPGFWWNVTGDSTLYAKVQVPFLTNLNGIQQVDPTYILGTQFLIR